MNDGTTSETTSDSVTITNFPEITDVQDLDRTAESIFNTGEGTIHIIHEITLGDLLTSTLLLMLLIMMFISKIARR